MNAVQSRGTVAAIRKFEQAIDRETLEMFLENACDEKFDILVAIMRDPAYAKKSLAEMTKMARVTLIELQTLYIDGMRKLAEIQMSNQLPDVMADVTEDARSRMESCPRCDGLKVVPFGELGTRECPQCKGDGEVRRIGDKHARDLVFQTAKLTGQHGPLLAIQQNFVGGDERMESMLKKTRHIVLEHDVTTKLEQKTDGQ